ncbi:MAG TPA: DEAD/DEAH box helicase [Acidimicrobiia bacterium]|nr:DEAD/DEAH box helicase [Acidimicrobiia bacterium]
MDACDTVGELCAHPELSERVVFRATLPARPSRFAEPERELRRDTMALLGQRKIDALYTHQAQAVDALRAGRNVVVATGTASGKSLCYQVPILESALSGRSDTALLLFPTKALAQDQLRSLRSWMIPGLRAYAYDGDTAPDERAEARRRATVLLTNPDMLHVGILPTHQKWATFLMRLRYVVVDELHTLRGIFGSHVAHLLRRLRRLCAHYGSDPVFCFSSATIGNPGELASTLCGLPVEVIDDDGAPQAERSFVCWQRPVVDERSGARTSGNVETAHLLARFVAGDHQTLAFTRTRTSTELVAANARRALESSAPLLASRVNAYRGGYLATERRALEEGLNDRSLLGVAATTALELGVDIGGLDAIVLNGFPGTLASMWQQVGRAGRSGRRAAAVLVAGDDQLDQWYAAHADQLLTRRPEAAVVNPGNPFVATPHIACAAHELPLTHDDDQYFGDQLDDVVRDLVLSDELKPRGDRMFWCGRDAPSRRVGLRSGSSVEFRLVDCGDDRLVGTVDGARVFHVAHEGAIYLHQGRQYRVERLDLRDHVAYLVPADDADEYTQTRDETDIEIRGVTSSRPIGAGVASVGEVDVTSRVVGYQRTRASTNERIEVVELDLPPQSLVTRACWYTLPHGVLESAGVEPNRVLGTVHAAEHALIGLLPLFAICDRWDVGGVSMAWHPVTGEPTIFVYDGYPGGAGIAELAYDALDSHVAATRELVAGCSCEDGCPSCVQSPKCGNWNEHLDKHGAIALLGLLAGGSSA